MKINRLHIKEGLEIFYCALNSVDSSAYQMLLCEHDLRRISDYKSPLRKNQFYWERFILREVLGSNIKIDYSESGKPFLSNLDKHISITHTQSLVAIGLGNNNLGIDLEVPRPSLEKVKNRFLSAGEIRRFNLSDLESLSFLWNLKEAGLKFVGDATLDYQNDIEIMSCDFQEKAMVSINYKSENLILKSSLKKIENHTLAVVYNDYTC